MMSSKRDAYASALDWLADLKKDYFWQRQLERLQSASAAEMDNLREESVRKIEKGSVYELWVISKDVEKIVQAVWGESELTLTKLMIQTIGMLSMEWIEQHGEVVSGNGLPEPLASEEAKKYWKRLQKAGFVDAGCKLKQETTRQQAMYIAEVFAEKLNIKSKWKTFQQFWGINNLAQEKNKFLETGQSPKRSNEIDVIFKD